MCWYLEMVEVAGHCVVVFIEVVDSGQNTSTRARDFWLRWWLPGRTSLSHDTRLPLREDTSWRPGNKDDTGNYSEPTTCSRHPGVVCRCVQHTSDAVSYHQSY